MIRLWLSAIVSVATLAACGATSPPWASRRPPAKPVAPARGMLPPHRSETRFADLRQLTFGGENAEAYWSPSGTELIFQAHQGKGCDQIYSLKPFADEPTPKLLSTGKGATTCGYFFPSGRSILYSSTHLGGEACPEKPDRSQGYVWPLYESYDIFKANADGSGLVRLTDAAGYDAEATVCPKDGTVVFTSVRDGDIELYRMDADGKNVARLTNAPGYDGGAFFSRDCSQIVWRASRPTGTALQDFERLLGQGLVRPSQLELWVANRDGSEARQITYLGAASFAPYFFLSGKRVIFSSNHGDPNGREFDLWAVDTDGTDLERITYTEGFDGFPMFSPDGRFLAFGSNRANAPGSHDTNLFVATWSEGGSKPMPELAADRVRRDVAWLADPARDGRGIDTPGLEASGKYIQQRFEALGVEVTPQPFELTTGLRVAAETTLTLGTNTVPSDAFRPLSFSAEGSVSGRLVLAGYGIADASLRIDDYRGVNARGAIAVVRRFVPDTDAFQPTYKKRLHGDLRRKAWLARERGAKALLVVDAPARPKGAAADWKPAEEATFPALRVEGPGDAGIPVMIVQRAALAATVARLEQRQAVNARISVKLQRSESTAFNVIARLRAPTGSREAVVVGAHYDHLGRGGHPGSLAPDSDAPHLGADDNASGVAALLETAKLVAARKDELRRDVVFAAFSAEESGVLGSTHFTKNPAPGLDPKQIVAMLNLDMVGRLRENRLALIGTESAEEWPELLRAACDKTGLSCNGSGDGYGPSDQTPFYAAGVPVLHLFTGAHADYHKPADTVEQINAAGLARIALLTSELALGLAASSATLTYKKGAAPTPVGDLRSFNASLGTIPDYSGPPKGERGVLLAGLRTGSAAEKAGLRRGDILIRLGSHEIGDVRDLMYALNASKPGQTMKVVVIRAGRRIELQVVLEQSRQRR